jgi:hypothetical protein
MAHYRHQMPVRPDVRYGGHSRHSDRGPMTSDLPRKADLFSVCRHISKVPMPEVAGLLGDQAPERRSRLGKGGGACTDR